MTPSGVPGVDALGNRACVQVSPATVLNNANQYDSPAATSCYAISTTNNAQCWPAQGLLYSNNNAATGKESVANVNNPSGANLGQRVVQIEILARLGGRGAGADLKNRTRHQAKLSTIPNL